MARTVYVIQCGMRKLDRPAPAADLYTGPYFKASLAYARRHVSDADIFILSAEHAIVPLTRILAPYNVKLTRITKAFCERLGDTLVRHGLQAADVEIVALLTGKYLEAASLFLRHRIIATPIAGKSLGRALSFLSPAPRRSR